MVGAEVESVPNMTYTRAEKLGRRPAHLEQPFSENKKQGDRQCRDQQDSIVPCR